MGDAAYDTPPSKGREHAEQIVESLWARAATRILLPALVPVLGALGLFLGSQIWNDTRETAKGISALRESVIQLTGNWALVKQQLDLSTIQTQAQIDQTNKVMNDRFQAQGNRVQKVEERVDDIQRRIYIGPTPGGPR